MAQGSAAGPMTPISRGYLWFTLLILFAINTLNFFDRQVLAVVQESVRREWDLSDSQLGWLGTAFIIFYAFVGLPLGLMADRFSRRWLLAGGIALWSMFTLASGFVNGYAMLFLCRLGVGVGEASCAPAATSLLGELFPAERRARATAIFMLGLPLGLALSFLVSAPIARDHGWRAAFLVAGVPGLLLALLALLLPEGQRGASHAKLDPDVPFLQGCLEVVRRPGMFWIIVSGALHNFNMYAVATFLSSFFQRYHGLTAVEAAPLGALVYGFGAFGIYGGGWLGDWAVGRLRGGRLQVTWIAIVLSVPFLLLALEVPGEQAWLCATLLLIGCTLMYGYYGTVYAVIQDLHPPRQRGLAMSVYFFGMYVLGAVWGPVLPGKLSDSLAQRAATSGAHGSAPEVYRAIGLHQAMYVVPILALALVIVLWLASKQVSRRTTGSTNDATGH